MFSVLNIVLIYHRWWLPLSTPPTPCITRIFFIPFLMQLYCRSSLSMSRSAETGTIHRSRDLRSHPISSNHKFISGILTCYTRRVRDTIATDRPFKSNLWPYDSLYCQTIKDVYVFFWSAQYYNNLSSSMYIFAHAQERMADLNALLLPMCGHSSVLD